MKTYALTLLALIGVVGAAHAGQIQDRWTAEARETRDGREYRTLLTMSFDGTLDVGFNGKPVWKADVLCEVRDPKTGTVETITGSAPAGMGQGAFEGVTKTVGKFHIREPDVDNGVVVDPGELTMTDRRCASGKPTTVHDLVPKPASPKVGSAVPTGRQLGNNGKPFNGYLWFHNGSDMLVDEEYGEIRYDKPKASIAKAVKPGQVLFKGTFHKDGTVDGTAFAFKLGCEPAPYPVKGRYPNPVTFTNGRMVLTGLGPKRKPGSCEIDHSAHSTAHSRLVFDANSDI